MTQRSILLIALAVCVLFAAGTFWLRSRWRDDTVEYLGQTIQLSKPYPDFDEYKNDPNNLAASEIPRVQKLVSEAPVPPSLAGEAEFAEKVLMLQFPGYGSTTTQSKPQSDGSILHLFAIEIPKTDR